MVVAPLVCCLFFTTLMYNGLPSDMPVGVVDDDNTATTRDILRNMDAFKQVGVTENYPSVSEARRAMQEGKIYAFYYIPKGTTEDVIANRKPKVSFYTNNSLLIAGSLIYRDLRTMSVLANASVILQTLQAEGMDDQTAMAFLQPIVIDTHALSNPWLNYSVYLNNTILPGILMILIFMVTVFSIGSELKDGTSKEWMAMADQNILNALIGKLLPHTLIFFIVASAYDVYLYGVLSFPCHSGIGPLMLAALLMVLASQAFGVLVISLLPTLRLALSTCSLWGVVSFSISGFTFPVMAMHPALQMLSNLFPLRHYFLIYVNHTLNGYPMVYAWRSYLALLLFILAPLFFLKRLRTVMLNYDYIP
ncbi:MAG: ABC transporter permease [Paraprevotella sp.]|nr:ABC transporter permease [Paraprevotella sp.]